MHFNVYCSDDDNTLIDHFANEFTAWTYNKSADGGSSFIYNHVNDIQPCWMHSCGYC